MLHFALLGMGLASEPLSVRAPTLWCTASFPAHIALQIIAAMHAYHTRPRSAWVLEWPAMVVLAVSQIFWARGVEEALQQGSVQVCGSLHRHSIQGRSHQ